MCLNVYACVGGDFVSRVGGRGGDTGVRSLVWCVCVLVFIIMYK